jgi:hypothetical protein
MRLDSSHRRLYRISWSHLVDQQLLELGELGFQRPRQPRGKANLLLCDASDLAGDNDWAGTGSNYEKEYRMGIG